MKKTLIALTLLSTISLSLNVAYAEEDVKTITNNEQTNQLQDPNSSNVVSDNTVEEGSKDKKFNISNIIDEMKNKDISTEDISEYTGDIKNKINESMVSYFNEIQSSLKILTADNSVASDDIKSKVSALNDKINDTIKSFNDGDKEQKIKDDFQSISQDYIKIIKDYKVQIDNKIQEKKEELKKVNEPQKTSSSK